MLYISALAPLVLLLITINEGAIISQSAIRDCSWGDSSEPSSPGGEICKKKMLISMVLGSAQGNTEALYANVGKAHEQGNDKMSVLKKPFRIELRKTAVIVSYRALKLGSANALPKETAISKKNCNDNFYSRSKRLPCGIQKSKSGKRVWDSQGFCCRCDSLNKAFNVRGNQKCGLSFFQGKGSAHCMKMNDLWYDVFELEMPMMQYRITLDMLEFQGINTDNGTKTVNWTPISTFHLSPSRTIGRSKDGRITNLEVRHCVLKCVENILYVHVCKSNIPHIQVVAEVQGSLLGSKAIKDLSAKRLLIPSVRMWPKKKPYPPQYTNGPNDWMLVDSHMVSLSGMECNKVGVSYVGFRRQPGRCVSQFGSCFHSQPLQLWNSDNKRRKSKKRGNYMIHNFGKVYHGSHPNKNSFILQFIHDDLHNSFITLRIDASDIAFVKSVSSGRIVETHTTKFMAGTTSGSLTVEIVNTGEISSEYTVSVTNCSGNMFRIPDQKLTLEPGVVKNVTFMLRSGGKKGGKKECQVQLLDSNYALLQTAKVSFKVDAACLCFGTCGCACDNEMKGVKCNKKTAGPSVSYKPGPIFAIVLIMVLESIGAHGFIAFFGGLLLILGFIKLSCGGILCCRKTKQQEHTERLLKKGVPPKSPLLVQCSGECRGAKAAKARYMRKVQRLKQAGKSPHRLDDWRNTSFECQCKSELTDIRFVHVVRAVCFFYFCCLLPFISIGRCVVWRFFKDTEEKKAKAEQEVLLRAKKKGNMEKYGVIDLATELKKMEEDTEGKTSGKKDDDQSVVTQALVMNIDYSAMGKSEEPKASVKNELNMKQMIVDGGFERGIQNQTASPQFDRRTEKQRKDATSTIKRQGQEREPKGERYSGNKSNVRGPKQKLHRTKCEHQAQNGSQQMNFSTEKELYERDTREMRVKVEKREVASGRKVDREKEQKGAKGYQRGHKSYSKGKYHKSLQSPSPKPAGHSMRESLSHSGSGHAHPLSSLTSRASNKSKDSLHIQNSGEMESCRESLNKASDHSGSEAGNDIACEHSSLHTSHSVPCASSHSAIHHSASHTSSQHSVHSQLCQKSSISKHSDSQDSCKSGSESHSSNGDANHGDKSHNSDDDGCSNNDSHSDDEGGHSNEGCHSDSHSNSHDEGGCSNEGSQSHDEGGCSNEGSHSHDEGVRSNEGCHSDSHRNSHDESGSSNDDRWSRGEGGCSNEGDIDSGGEVMDHSNSGESSSESEESSESATENNTESGSVGSTYHGNASQ